MDTYNIWTLQKHEYVSIGCDVRAATTLRAKLGHVFGPPGWQPAQSSSEPVRTR